MPGRMTFCGAQLPGAIDVNTLLDFNSGHSTRWGLVAAAMLLVGALLFLGGRYPPVWLGARSLLSDGPVTIQGAHLGDASAVHMGAKAADSQQLSLVSWPIALQSQRLYVVEFTVTNAGRQPVSLTIDIQGDGYGSAEQTLRVELPPNGEPIFIRQLLNSGNPPPDARFRLFFFGPGEISIFKPALLERPTYWRWLRVFGAVLATLSVMAVLLGYWRNVVQTQGTTRSLTSSETMFAVVTACLAVAIALFIYVSRLGPPIIFSDEFLHAYVATHFGHEDAIANSGWHNLDIPNRLYLWLYHWTTVTAGDPYAVARTLNVLFVVLAAGAMVTCARIAGAGLAAYLLPVAFALGPQSTYAAYFMPDVVFVSLLFWLIVIACRAMSTSKPAMGAVAGFLAGALALIKPHGLVVITVVFAVMLAMALWLPGRHPSRRSAFALAATFLSVAVGARELGAIWLAPNVSGGALLTGAYTEAARAMLGALLKPAFISAILKLVCVHAVIVLAIGGPAVLAAGPVLKRWIKHGASNDQGKLFAELILVVSVVLLAALLVMTSVFTISTAGRGSYETPNRLHMRYYAFCLPLIVLAFSAIGGQVFGATARQRGALWIWLIAILGLGFALAGHQWFVADSPEIFVDESHSPWKIPVLLFTLSIWTIASFRLLPRAPMAVPFLLSHCAYAVVVGFAVRTFQLATGPVDADRIGRVAASLARAAQTPLVVSGNGYPPDVFRIASYALERIRFVDLNQIGVQQAAGKLQPRTLLVAPATTLVDLGLPALLQVGPWALGQVPAAASNVPHGQ